MAQEKPRPLRRSSGDSLAEAEPTAAKAPWIDELSSVISEVVGMRATDPDVQLGRMLGDPRHRPNWTESAEAYSDRHQLAEKITAALEEAGIVPSQPHVPDALSKLSKTLLHRAGQPVETASMVPDDPARQHAEQMIRRKSVEARSKDPIMSTRMMYRKSLYHVVGNQGGSWRDDYTRAEEEGSKLLGRTPYGSSSKLHAHNLAKGYFQERVKEGFTEEEAEIIGAVMSGPIETALAKALKEDSSRYAGLTRDATLAVSRQAARMKAPAPRTYAFLRTPDGKGAADKDARWDDILRPDHTGFVGLTSFTTMPLRPATEGRYSAQGLLRKMRGQEVTSEGPVLCVLSDPMSADGQTFHSAVRVADGDYILPPLTLFAVKEVVEEFEYLEGRPKVQQRCIYLRPTFMVAPGVSKDNLKPTKFATASVMLAYGSTAAFVTSLTPIIKTPVLSMRDEWLRGDEWVDRAGATHDARTEWAYVTGAVSGEASTRGTGVGARDDARMGWDLPRFVAEGNGFIRENARKMGREVHEERDLLDVLEVLAIRLFTGPGFQVINEFLRQLAKLEPDYRRRVAQQPNLTYSSTCHYLINGLRKLARFTPLPEQPLFRGVRGMLPRGTKSLRDVSGAHVAVEYGFMSTSPDLAVCKAYMDSTGQNILWQLNVASETDEAFHMGADVSRISQYPAEKEITFPPYTMLVVEHKPSTNPNPSATPELSFFNEGSTNENEYGCVRIVAKPHFI